MQVNALYLYRWKDAAENSSYVGQSVTAGGFHQELLSTARRVLFEGSGRGMADFSDDTASAKGEWSLPVSAADQQAFHAWSGEFVRRLAQWHQTENGKGVPMAPVVVTALCAHPGHDALFVAMTEQKPGFVVTDELELMEVSALAMDKGIRVLEIDLHGLRDSSSTIPPVRFAGGRVGRRLGDPLFDVLALKRDEQAVSNGTQLATSVAEACTAAHMPAPEQVVVKKAVNKYCAEKYQDGMPVVRDELCDLMTELTGNESLGSAMAAQGLDQDTFMVAPIGMRKGSRYAGAGKGMSLSFDRALLGHTITFNKEEGTLIIRDLPPNLLDQLIRSGEDVAS